MDSKQETLIIVGAGRGYGQSLVESLGGDLETLETLALAAAKERPVSAPHTFAERYGGSMSLEGCERETCKPDNGAVGMLEEAAECIGDRASERDSEEERSMAATVRAFNGMFDTEITEEQGWHFMALLKMARAKGGDFRRDDYVDGAAYFALAGECRGSE